MSTSILRGGKEVEKRLTNTYIARAVKNMSGEGMWINENHWMPDKRGGN